MNSQPEPLGRGDAPLPCPACGGATVFRKCKEVCARCGVIVQNCSGD